MKQYLAFLEHILAQGTTKDDRTNTGTISTFGYQMRFNLQDGFPLVTTKKVHTKSIIHELLWFISGSTNIRPLVLNNVKIWNAWPYETYKKHQDYQGESLDDYVEKIKADSEFATKHGDLGPVYGKQWRDFNGIDQLKWVLKEAKRNPSSRRLIVNSWNPSEINDMALPPCHMMFQFYIKDGTISCHLYQRSGDAFLGIPFNIASYALLTMMVAQVLDLTPGEFVHTIGDAHIYSNHISQVKTQLSRDPRPLPTMTLNKNVKDLFAFTYDDFTLENYTPHKAIKGKVAV